MKTIVAIMEDEEKIFLLRRANTSAFEGFWALPGGKIDSGEDEREAIKREVTEETNLNFEPLHFFGRYEEHFLQYGWDSDTDVFYGSFSGNVRINEESSDYGWFSLDDIKEMDLAFHHKRIIREYFKQKIGN